MSKKEMQKLEEILKKDEALRNELVEQSQKTSSKEEFVVFLENKIMPVVKKHKLNITEKDLLNLELESLKNLSLDDLSNVSGGVSMKSVAAAGGVLSAILLGASFGALQASAAEPGSGSSFSVPNNETKEIEKQYEAAKDEAAQIGNLNLDQLVNEVKEGADSQQAEDIKIDIKERLETLPEALNTNDMEKFIASVNELKNQVEVLKALPKKGNVANVQANKTTPVKQTIDQKYEQAKTKLQEIKAEFDKIKKEHGNDDRYKRILTAYDIDINNMLKIAKGIRSDENKEDYVKLVDEMGNRFEAIKSIPEYLKTKKGSEGWEISPDFLMIIGKYFKSNQDFINAMKVNKKYEDLVLMYKFNPISETDLFQNIQTQHFYKEEDVENKIDEKFQYIHWEPVDYNSDKFKNRKDNEIFKNVNIDYDVYKTLNDKEKHVYNVIFRKSDAEINNGICVVPEGVTKIGDECFKGCQNLTNITLPSTLKEIGEGAFANSNVNNVIIPEGITKIEYGCFRNCQNLTNITLPSTLKEIEDNAFLGSNVNNVIIPEGVTGIGYDCFYECTNLTTITLPSTLTEIWERAFAYSRVNNVIIPEGVTKIRNECFSYCTNLENITLPSTLKEMGESAFEGSNVNNVIIPEGVTEIGSYCFKECQNLTNITLPSSIKEIGNSAFAWTKVNNVIIPEGVTEIRNECFSYCTNLENITLPSTLKEMGKSAFEGSNVNNVIIPEGVTEIGAHCFENCQNLTNITLPSSIKEIGEEAFEASNVNNLIIPEGITKIKYGCFVDCDNLTNITLSSTLTEIGERAFEASNVNNLIIPEGVTKIRKDCFKGCQNLKNITLPKTLKEIEYHAFLNTPLLANVEVKGLKNGDTFECKVPLFVKNILEAKGIKCPNCCIDEGDISRGIVEIKNGSCLIPEGVTEIGDNCFEYYYNLTNITLSSTLKKIGKGAFAYSRVNNVIIPEGVTEIGGGCFFSNDNLTTITFPSTLTEIGKSAFAYSKVNNVIIPEGVTKLEMGSCVFKNCFHGTLLIPASVKTLTLDPDTFEGSSIEKLYVPEALKNQIPEKIKNSNKIKVVYYKYPAKSWWDNWLYLNFSGSIEDLTLDKGLLEYYAKQAGFKDISEIQAIQARDVNGKVIEIKLAEDLKNEFSESKEVPGNIWGTWGKANLRL